MQVLNTHNARLFALANARLDALASKFEEAKANLTDVTERLLGRYHKWASISVPNVVLRQLQGFAALQVHMHRHGADAFEGTCVNIDLP